MDTDPADSAPLALRLADALCARLCHDLSSPLGTLTGALEMVADDPSSLEDALPIANDTAASMVARLRLLRAAWSGDCGPQDVAQLQELAMGLPPRIRTDMAALRHGPFDGPMARILLNLMLLAAEALPRGGAITLASGQGGAVAVTVTGKAAAWPDGLAQALADPAGVRLDNPRAVQPPITAMLAQVAGRRLALGDRASGADMPPPLLLEG